MGKAEKRLEECGADRQTQASHFSSRTGADQSGGTGTMGKS